MTVAKSHAKSNMNFANDQRKYLAHGSYRHHVEDELHKSAHIDTHTQGIIMQLSYRQTCTLQVTTT